MISLQYAGNDMVDFSGSIVRTGVPGADDKTLQAFAHLPFDWMFQLLSGVLSSHPEETECTLQRIDVPDGLPVVLDRDLTDLLRRRPADVVAQLTYQTECPAAPRTGGRRPPPALVGGTESLRNVLGDTLYVRAGVHATYECPLCGRWADLKPGTTEHTHRVCGGTVYETDSIPGYLGIDTRRLLERTDATRFWLPTLWGQDSRWTPRELLADRYQDFCNNQPKE